MLPAALGLAVSLAAAISSAASVDKSGVRPQAVSLPKGPGSISGLGRLPEPTLHTGEVTYTVAIEVPPGVLRHEPELTLRYSSLGGNSPFGIGWGLDLPAIQRRTDKGLPTYGPSDTFIYRGEELVELSDGSFRAKNEGLFARFKRLPCGGWEMREKSGRILRLGLYPSREFPTRQSRETGPPLEPQTPEFDRTFRWLVDEIEDVHGNLIEFQYTSLPESPGPLYPDRISYNLRAENAIGQRLARPHYAVAFAYEPRPDRLSEFRSGYEQCFGHRCREIRVLLYDAPDRKPEGRLIRRDLFDYRPDRTQELSALSRLYRIEQQDRLGNRLPSTRFDYYDVEIPPENTLARISHATEVPFAFPRGPGSTEVDFLDVNGDALPDLVQANREGWSLSLNQGGGAFGPWQDFTSHARGVPGIGLGDPRVQLLDVDGDGSIELVHQRGFQEGPEAGLTFRRLVSRGRLGAEPVTVGWGELETFAQPLQHRLDSSSVRFVDADGDGAVDVLFADIEGIRFLGNVAQGATRTWGREPCLYPHSTLGRGGEFRAIALEPLALRRLHSQVICDER